MTPRLLISPLIALTLLVPAAAQQPDAPQPGAEQRRRELLERYRSLSPEQRQRLQELYRERLQELPAEERRELRERLEERSPQERARLRARLESFRELDEGEQREYRRLVHRLVERLPDEERAAFEGLEPEARRRRLQELLHEHREGRYARFLDRLPSDLAELIRTRHGELPPQQRVRALRQEVEAYVRNELQDLRNQPNLPPRERRQRVHELLRLIPGKRREHLRRELGLPGPDGSGRNGPGRDGEGRPGPRGDREGAGRPGPRGDGSPRRGPNREGPRGGSN